MQVVCACHTGSYYLMTGFNMENMVLELWDGLALSGLVVLGVLFLKMAMIWPRFHCDHWELLVRRWAMGLWKQSWCWARRASNTDLVPAPSQDWWEVVRLGQFCWRYLTLRPPSAQWMTKGDLQVISVCCHVCFRCQKTLNWVTPNEKAQISDSINDV